MRYHSLREGHKANIQNMDGLRFVLKGIRRVQGNSWVKKERDPILPSHVRLLGHFLRSHFTLQDFVMIMSAITLAFFGLLRSSEYTSMGSKHFDKHITLTRRDITFIDAHTFMTVYIKGSKTRLIPRGVSRHNSQH